MTFCADISSYWDKVRFVAVHQGIAGRNALPGDLGYQHSVAVLNELVLRVWARGMVAVRSSFFLLRVLEIAIEASAGDPKRRTYLLNGSGLVGIHAPGFSYLCHRLQFL